MSRGREAADWDVDRLGALAGERDVALALRGHPLIGAVQDRSGSTATPDFEFVFAGALVRLELKEKRQRYTAEIGAVWPEVPEQSLLIVDELALRQLMWAEGIGYVVIADRPQRRWHFFGPWELWLAPRRRYERPGDKGSGTFLKGKVLLDARTAGSSTPSFDVDALLNLVRRSRLALSQVQAIDIHGHGPLPTVPQVDRSTIRPVPKVRPVQPATPESPVIAEEAPDQRWCGLSAPLVNAIQTRWGWRSLTAVQQVAVPAILGQQTTLVLGPTAGGKTEAAMLPLLDRWRLDGWSANRPSILCLSPLKALLDDQLDRWQRGAALVGASAFTWHGDVGFEEKRAFRADPADILLTTPESLESWLARPEDRERLVGLRAVVIDEAHSFVGDPRGAQVASLLERLERFTAADLQRIALSATVSDPAAVVAWLKGRSLREAGAVDGGSATIGEIVSIRSHESVDEALATIEDERRDRRCLVFAASRRRVEELALGLGLPAHHSSVAGDRRTGAVAALRTGAVDALVTSSSLELGLDVGDLDLVIHDGPPPGPSSYLQRLGRSGRRSGHRALTFLVGSPDELLLVLATLLRARRHDLDPTLPKRGARLVLGQQALLLTHEHRISDRRALYETLRYSPLYAGLHDAIEATIDHLVATKCLVVGRDAIAVSTEAKQRFGLRLEELRATFGGSSHAPVEDEQGRAVGEVDWSLVEASDASARRNGLVLGGRRWQVVSVTASPRKVVVAPGGRAVARGWRGPSLPVSRATWEAAREVLGSTEVPTDADPRSETWLQDLRDAWSPRLESPFTPEAGGVAADTFAGDAVHRAVLHILGVDGTTDGPTLHVSAPPGEVRRRAVDALDHLPRLLDGEAERTAAMMTVAHRALCAPEVIIAEAREFAVDEPGIRAVLTLLATWRS